MPNFPSIVPSTRSSACSSACSSVRSSGDASSSVLLVLPASVDREDPATLARAVLALELDEAALLTVLDDGSVLCDPIRGASPIEAMCGTTAPPHVRMAGLAAPAVATRRDEDRARDGRVVHLVDRDGVSATALCDEHGEVLTFGPDRSPQSGRVPDACRRVLGLPTEPPETTMTPFVFTAWLVVVSGHDRELLDWPAVVALHPVGSTLAVDPTAVDVATATRELGEAMDWDRYRRLTASIGGFPFGADGAAVAAWSDAGLFSRWAMDELPDARDALHGLARSLGADVLDRLWAVAHLCGAIDGEDVD